MTKSTRAILIAAAVSLLASSPLYSASIEEFQTEEYYGSGGLDLINAAEAYSKGYTGKGVTIGINDHPVNLEHESFADKTGSKYIGSMNLEGINWNEYNHGSHVGGIAAGSKNGKGMHGVAFDAEIVSTYYLWDDDHDFSKYDSSSQIKSINNSWNSDSDIDGLINSDELDEDSTADKVFKQLVTDFNNYNFEPMNKSVFDTASKDKLLIFSSGNFGYQDKDLMFHWPLIFKYDDCNNNIITVTSALNSYGENKHLIRNPDGSITGDFVISSFPNLAKYGEDSIISAPGWNIMSANAADKDVYITVSGSSMAAPFVTGGAALVEQAFPYLNSKQIGDVLLSTANSNIKTEYPFSVTNTLSIKGNDDDGNPVYNFCVRLFYTDGRSESSEEQILDDLNTFAKIIINDDFYGNYAVKVISRAISLGNIRVYYQTPIQEFVGQGILDVGKAVSGPGALNARRLEKENISEKYLTDGQKTLMYEIDTKGYDSVWSNDIKEILVGKLSNDSIEEDLRQRYNYYNINWISNNNADRWEKLFTEAYVEQYNKDVDENGLEGLHVGLLKSGKGILKLEGNNTYKGATVVTDGAIAVNGSVAGDAYSENEGIITGKGKINGTLYNNNIAIAGDGGEGNLSMGALESKGLLASTVNNGENSKFIVEGNADVDGSTVVVEGLTPGESCTILTAGSISGELANSKENTEGTSGFLKEYAKIENNEVKYVYDFSPNFECVSPKQAKAFDMIKNMYFSLMSDYHEGNASIRPSARAVTSPQQMAQILTFINLPAQQAGPALNAVVNNAAAQSMTLVQRNSFVGDILSSHFADRFQKDLPPQVAGEVSALADKRGLTGLPRRCAPRNDDNGAWFKFTYNKGEMRDGARYRGRSGIIGYDLKLTDTKSFGLFFGQANNTLDGFEDSWAKNKIEENRFGIYSSKKNDKYSGYLFLDYGKVDNELNRNLTNLGLSTNVKYKGDLYEIGGEYKLTPKNQRNKTWKVYPYVNMMFSKYKQDGYTEKDGGIYNHVVESKTNNYAAGQLGLEFNFTNEKENYVLRLAGKRAFSGADPKVTFSFAGDMANKYELDNDQDKNHLLVSFKGERKISTNTLLSADFSMQRGSHDRDMKASLSFWRKF